MPIAAMTAADDEERPRAAAAPRWRATSRSSRRPSTRHRDQPEHEARRATPPRMIAAGRDRRRQQAVQRPVLALGQDREGAVLGGEEDEHDRHRGAVERGEAGLALGGRVVDDRDRARRRRPPADARRRSPRRRVPAGRGDGRTVSWPAPDRRRRTRSTAARATSRAVGHVRRGCGPRVGVAAWIAAREAGRDDDRSPGRPRRPRHAASASVGARR